MRCTDVAPPPTPSPATVTQVYVTDQQGRLQFTMWAMMASPLILSQNVRNLTAMQLATYS
jgi:hypothetical protein